MYRRQQPYSNSTIMLAGWLLADLLLALTIIFLASSSTDIKLTTTTTAATITPTPTPTPTALPQIAGVDPNPTEISITINSSALLAGDTNETNSIKTQVQQQLQNDSQKTAAITLTFGGQKGDPLDQGRGTQISSRINEILNTFAANSFIFSSKTVYRPYISLDQSSEIVDIDIYFYIYNNS